MELIDGKKVAAEVKQEIAAEVEQMIAEGKRRPHLVAILVGHDGGSETYVRNKVIACEQCGFKSTLIRYEDDVTENELLDTIDKLNKDADVDGFIVQLPLPRHISTPSTWAACPSVCRASFRQPLPESSSFSVATT